LSYNSTKQNKATFEVLFQKVSELWTSSRFKQLLSSDWFKVDFLLVLLSCVSQLPGCYTWFSAATCGGCSAAASHSCIAFWYSLIDVQPVWILRSLVRIQSSFEEGCLYAPLLGFSHFGGLSWVRLYMDEDVAVFIDRRRCLH